MHSRFLCRVKFFGVATASGPERAYLCTFRFSFLNNASRLHQEPTTSAHTQDMKSIQLQITGTFATSNDVKKALVHAFKSIGDTLQKFKFVRVSGLKFGLTLPKTCPSAAQQAHAYRRNVSTNKVIA